MGLKTCRCFFTCRVRSTQGFLSQLLTFKSLSEMEAQRGHHDKLDTSNMCVCMCLCIYIYIYLYTYRKNQAPKHIEDGIEYPQNEGEDK